MNVLCWNCRGIGNPRTVHALWKWCASFAPVLVFLSETKTNNSRSESIKNSLGFNCAFGVSSVGKSGGLCFYWNSNNIDFDLVSYSANHICGKVSQGDVSWYFIGIYGWPDSSDKHKTWHLIHSLCSTLDGPLPIGVILMKY